jgi:SLT domain-containing protein
MGESGWRTNALNASSGAYGIPQSLPASKMASAGSDWKTNPATQIEWGLKYIRSRYGSPGGAYNAWQARSPHWYDQGGWLPEGLSLTMNKTGKPERIRNARQEAQLAAALSSNGGGMAVTFVNRGVIGSQAELEKWLVGALDSIGRKHRVPKSFRDA